MFINYNTQVFSEEWYANSSCILTAMLGQLKISNGGKKRSAINLKQNKNIKKHLHIPTKHDT